MTKPISAAAASSIEAAISRLMGSGDVQATFTIARLASEAGLSRATLYRAPELLERFRTAMASHEREMKSPPSSTDRVHQLEAEIAALRGRETEELRALRSSNRNMAQHIQALSLLVRKQEQRIARLQAESSESGRVATFVEGHLDDQPSLDQPTAHRPRSRSRRPVIPLNPRSLDSANYQRKAMAILDHRPHRSAASEALELNSHHCLKPVHQPES
jgi:hypothetical protein